MDWEKIKEAYEIIKKGTTKHLDLNMRSVKVKLYEVGPVIRIDIKPV